MSEKNLLLTLITEVLGKPKKSNTLVNPSSSAKSWLVPIIATSNAKLIDSIKGLIISAKSNIKFSGKVSLFFLLPSAKGYSIVLSPLSSRLSILLKTPLRSFTSTTVPLNSSKVFKSLVSIE